MARLNYYIILGINESASQAEIKKAFHIMARKYHPDVHGGDEYFMEKFK